MDIGGQMADVLDYIEKHGGISSKQANDDLGITRLSAVVFQLKKRGFVFDEEIKTGIDRRDKKTWWKVYKLA